MKHKKVLCSFATFLMACAFSTSIAVFTPCDVQQARNIAANRAPLRNAAEPYLDARRQYYQETLNHLTDVQNMGFAIYRRSIDYKWDIHNIPVLNRMHPAGTNFQATIDDAIGLYSFLLQNPQ